MKAGPISGLPLVSHNVAPLWAVDCGLWTRPLDGSLAGRLYQLDPLTIGTVKEGDLAPVENDDRF